MALVGLEGPVSTDVSGIVVSTATVRVLERPEAFPAASVAMAVNACEPSASPETTLLQLPPNDVAVTPLDATPSKSSTIDPGSAVPETVSVPLEVVAPSAGLVMAGDAGGVVSTVHVLRAGD